MEVEVYADLLFLINAGMDGLCLLLTGKLLHRRLRGWRVALAAVMGGVYAVVALFPEIGAGVSLLLDLGVCLAMCALVFRGRASGGIPGLLVSTGAYFIFSMTLGGIMTALYHLLNRAGGIKLLSQLTGAGGDGLGSWLFLLLALVGGGLSLWGGRLSRRARRVAYCAVAVELNGKRVELRGMVDSGNLLRDPLGGRAVICADAHALGEFLPPSLLAVMEEGTLTFPGLSSNDTKRVRIIPAGTATGSGILYGFLPDRTLLTEEGDTAGREVDAVVAVTHIQTNGVEALVPSDLM